MASLPLPPEAKIFLKSTFKLCSLDYKTLTIDVVKYYPSSPLSSPPLAARGEIFFVQLNYKNVAQTLIYNVLMYEALSAPGIFFVINL